MQPFRFFSVSAALLLLGVNHLSANFTVTEGLTDPNNSSFTTVFTREISVFGVKVYGDNIVSDAKLIHTANILAEYLDNDEDGNPDNIDLLEKLLERQAFMMVYDDERTDIPDAVNDTDAGQPLWNYEIHPDGLPYDPDSEEYDATQEEVFDMLGTQGWSKVYSTDLVDSRGSRIADAMDIARGGYFANIPDSYPEDAWFTYDDPTCDYSCMVSEYLYWGYSTYMGMNASENRWEMINEEWKIQTRADLIDEDPDYVDIVTDSEYSFPIGKTPDGNYPHAETAMNYSHSGDASEDETADDSSLFHDFSALNSGTWYLLGSVNAIDENIQETQNLSTVYIYSEGSWTKNPSNIPQGQGFWVIK